MKLSYEIVERKQKLKEERKKGNKIKKYKKVRLLKGIT